MLYGWAFSLAVLPAFLAATEIPLACQLVDEEYCLNQNSTADPIRIIAIGDVHGSHDGLMEVLYQAKLTASSSACKWRAHLESTIVVQMGDIVDRGPGATEAWKCLQDLQITTPPGVKLIRLLGNHELYWLQGYTRSRNKKADSEYKVKMLTKKMRDDILSGSVVAAFLMHIHNVPILFTHAGIRPAFHQYLQRKSITSPDDITSHLNTLLLGAMKKCSVIPCSFDNEAFEAGKDRGGRHIGGPYWTDFSVLETADASATAPLPTMLQVVGHTMAYCYDPNQPGYHPSRDEVECGDGLIRRTKQLNAVCTDAGMYAGARAFLELRNSREFIAHEKERDGRWTQRDFTREVCKGDY